MSSKTCGFGIVLIPLMTLMPISCIQDKSNDKQYNNQASQDLSIQPQSHPDFDRKQAVFLQIAMTDANRDEFVIQSIFNKNRQLSFSELYYKNKRRNHYDTKLYYSGNSRKTAKKGSFAKVNNNIINKKTRSKKNKKPVNKKLETIIYSEYGLRKFEILDSAN